MTSSLKTTLNGLAILAGSAVVVGLFVWGAGFTIADLKTYGWWVPMWVIVAGLVGGIFLVSSLASSEDQSLALMQQGRKEDLEDSRKLVVEQLRALEIEREKMSAEDYEQERAELLKVGAEAARRLDGGQQVAPAAAQASEAPDAISEQDRIVALVTERLSQQGEVSPDAIQAAVAAALADKEAKKPAAEGRLGGEWRGALYALGIAALIAVLYGAAQSGSRTRTEGMGMTGGDQVMVANEAAQQAQTQASPEEAGLQQALQENPNDLKALNRLTEIALGREDLQTALQYNLAAIEVSPEDPTARVYRSVLRAFIGRRQEALTDLDAVIAASPDFTLAYIYKGLLLLEQSPAESVVVLEKASALAPTDPQLMQLLAEARRRASEAPQGSTPANAPVAPAAQPTAASGSVLASGTITLADAAKAGSGTLFLSIKSPQGGPPVAAKKLPPGPFPMEFSLTSADITPMGGMRPMPETFVLTIRLDSDGDPLSRPETDPVYVMEEVTPGSGGIKAALQ